MPEHPGYAPDLEPDELAFQRLYGPVEPFSLSKTRDVFDSTGVTWWITGGHAIEAFTGVTRAHEDIDVSLFRRDLSQLRQALEGRLHLWSVGEGALRPVSDRFPDAAENASQVWLREHALAPWRVDVQLNPDLDGRWVSRRDESFVADLADVTWVTGGVRYLNPEMALAFKAKLSRPKDFADFDATLPLLEAPAREFLADFLARMEPQHPWRERL